MDYEKACEILEISQKHLDEDVKKAYFRMALRYHPDKYKQDNVIFICHEMVSKVMRGSLLQLKESEILSLNHKQNIVYSFSQGQLGVIEHV